VSTINIPTESQPPSTTLNEDQERAFNIIGNHLTANLAGKKPDQLLMILIGHGGVGKSTLINGVTELFDRLSARDLLAKTGTTAIATSHIGGTTLHWWAGLPIYTPKSEEWFEKAGKAIRDRRTANIHGKQYLILDEASMLTTHLMCMASQVMGQTHAGDGTVLFGGMNVIIVGDFHQFPPVGKGASTLYHENNARLTAQLGHAIYLQFDMVVILRKQMRITDQVWMDILNTSREGECTEDDINEM
jgi:hypothetical protein